MKAVATFLDERFGHEAGLEAVPCRQLFHKRPEHHHPVGGDQGGIMADVDLDLAGCIFRVRLLDRYSHGTDLLADGPQNRLQLRRPVEAIAIISLIAWQAGLRVEKIEFQLGAGADINAPGGGAVQLPDQRLTGVDGQRLVIHSLGAGETQRHAGLPRDGDRGVEREDMAIGKAVLETDHRRVPDITGHVHGEQRHRQRIA